MEGGDLVNGEVKFPPTRQWLRMHLPVPMPVPVIDYPPFLNEVQMVDAAEADRPVVWFRLFKDLAPLKRFSEWRSRIAWLSAGRDGLVFGRNLALDSDKKESWALHLVSHKSAEITDVDVDPTGRWLATAATEGVVCVSCFIVFGYMITSCSHSRRYFTLP